MRSVSLWGPLGAPRAQPTRNHLGSTRIVLVDVMGTDRNTLKRETYRTGDCPRTVGALEGMSDRREGATRREPAASSWIVCKRRWCGHPAEATLGNSRANLLGTLDAMEGRAGEA